MGLFRHVLAFATCGVLGGAVPGYAQEGTAANMSMPVQVFILLGQSNMVGLGKISGGDISLEHAVKKNGKYPEFKGNVATVYIHPMAQGGSGNGYYGGKAEVYMDVGEAIGRAILRLMGKGGPQ